MSLSINSSSFPLLLEPFQHMSSVAFGIENMPEIIPDLISTCCIAQPSDANPDKVLKAFFLKDPLSVTKTKSIYATLVKLEEKDSWDKFAWVRFPITPKPLGYSQNELFDQAAEAGLSIKRKYLTSHCGSDFLQPFAFYGNLLQMLSNSEPLTSQSLIYISRQCIDVVERLHAMGIFHCDIKPQNFLADDDDGRIRIFIDGFKFASKLEKTTQIFGSYHYCSLDHRLSAEVKLKQSDIFSLGLTLYTLCTCQFFSKQKDPQLLELERNPSQNWFKIENEYKKLLTEIF